jgi:hypothetical protein
MLYSKTCEPFHQLIAARQNVQEDKSHLHHYESGIVGQLHFPTQWLLESFSYKNETVMLAPATGFYTTKGLGLDEVRIAYVLKNSEMEKAFECLRVALEQYPGRTEVKSVSPKSKQTVS